MANLIYQPRGKALEYGGLACNPYRGCDNGCIYCYVPRSTRRKREEFNSPELRKAYTIKALAREAHRKRDDHMGETVFFSFSCDPYPALETDHRLTGDSLRVLKSEGYKTNVLTKTPLRPIKFGDLPFIDYLGTTITTLDTQNALRLEPRAHMPLYRLHNIGRAHEMGVTTWVSFEPLLYPGHVMRVIEENCKRLDHVKVGAFTPQPDTPTWLREHAAGLDLVTDVPRIIKLLERLGYRRTYELGAVEPRTYYIKDSLVKYIGETQ